MDNKPFFGTKMNESALDIYKSIYDLCSTISDLAPAITMEADEPINLRPNASVSIAFPSPIIILNVAVKKAFSLLFTIASNVKITSEEGRTVFTFTVTNIWEE